MKCVRIPSLPKPLSATPGAQLSEFRKQISEAYLHHRLTPEQYLNAHSRAVDEVVAWAARIACLREDLAIIAVGGYGSGQLYPYSDADLLILLPGDAEGADRAAIEHFTACCWDAGVRPAQHLATLEEIPLRLERDLAFCTALLECRLLSGPLELYHCFAKKYRASFRRAHFIRAKMLETLSRHCRYFEHPLVRRQANCKTAPGALRDIQLLRWLQKSLEIQLSASSAQYRADVQLERLLIQSDFCDLNRFFANLRIHVHLSRGRRDDWLDFSRLCSGSLYELLAAPRSPSAAADVFYSFCQRSLSILREALRCMVV